MDVPIKTKGVDRPGVEKIDDLRPLHHSQQNLDSPLSHLVSKIPPLCISLSFESPRNQKKSKPPTTAK